MNDLRYGRSPDVLWRRTYDRILLLVPSSGEVLTLAGTGVDLWSALSEPTTVSGIASSLAERYGTEAGAIEPDIATAVTELAEHGAVCTVA